MSLKDQIVSLEALAAIDAELKRLEDQLAEERGILANLKGELQKLDEKLGIDRASLGEMDKTRSELTTEVRQMTAQIERSREKLSRSRNERESNAAQRELEELRKLQRDREDEINKLSSLGEQARKTIEDTEAQHKKITDELGGCESDISAKLAAAVKEHETKLAERARLAAAVQPMTLRRYEQVRKRKGSAIAKTIDGTCLACHMRLPPMLFQKLMRGDALDQCPSCARILYYEAPADARDGGTS
ncbi:MAG TPA: C4-type zinc ribbon domain-containing protein [Polyangiaceae bacterium]|nr:C4-type zinc ribbon domain-containing protein [Polyangiaceae bacterium]